MNWHPCGTLKLDASTAGRGLAYFAKYPALAKNNKKKSFPKHIAILFETYAILPMNYNKISVPDFAHGSLISAFPFELTNFFLPCSLCFSY